MAFKNENKTMSDTQKRNETAWDERYASLLQTLEEYQEDKENPRKQVVDVDLDELLVHLHCRVLKWLLTLPQVQTAVQVIYRPV